MTTERVAEDEYEAQNDPSPVSGDVVDNSYVGETRRELREPDQNLIVTDQTEYDDPVQPPYSNSAQQLGMYIFFYY